MVTVYMTQKASERVIPPVDLSKVVNLYKVSNSGVKAFKTNFECQETLVTRKPVCLKNHETIRTLHDSFECRHPDEVGLGVFIRSQATCKHPELFNSIFSFRSSPIQVLLDRGMFLSCTART